MLAIKKREVSRGQELIFISCMVLRMNFAGYELFFNLKPARRIRQKQSVSTTQSNFNANAKRAQSVESMLDRIPNVPIHGGISPHSEVGKKKPILT